ncbi:hypothetical protein EPI10_024522 [Gossypium australe]|uniref:Uncharacterized protein n=1 Tax=Gossypium australe TaxID=47621 RepID=A0A5B6VZ33_9ROSI|nr:hypothetical protein EPI10_024522 [Gossypium australe]
MGDSELRRPFWDIDYLIEEEPEVTFDGDYRNINTSRGGQFVGAVVREATSLCMTRSRETPKEPVTDLKRIIQRSHRQQQQQKIQDPPPSDVGNIPHENPLFDEANDNALGDLPAPPQLPVNLHIACNERTLRDYTLPNLDMV